jgi:hypothetical protein
MRSKLRGILFTAITLLAGCATPVRPPAPPTPSVPSPKLEKTFGEIQTDADGALLIDYKTMRLMVDPAPQTTWDSARVDYLLLTSAAPQTLNVRKDLKIMAPPSAASWLNKQGYTQVKSLEAGSRVYLTKDNAFAFVSAAPTGTGERAQSGYLLEFDNGRNIYVSGRLSSVDVVREFTYGLRDDGKEIHVGIVSADTDQMAAEAIGLLQPQFSFYCSGARDVDQKTIDKMLAEQLYPGVFSLLKRGQSVSF